MTLLEQRSRNSPAIFLSALLQVPQIQSCAQGVSDGWLWGATDNISSRGGKAMTQFHTAHILSLKHKQGVNADLSYIMAICMHFRA